MQAGAHWINVHHKADIYPYINYPMVDEVVPDLKHFIDSAHKEHLKVRLYYTCRELTVKTPEFWMLRSLGDEIIQDGPGNDSRTLIYPKGPKPWLIHNLRKTTSRPGMPDSSTENTKDNSILQLLPIPYPAGTTTTSKGSTG